jgi:PAS domain S-box-containing protein
LELARRRRVAAERRRGEEALRAKHAEFELVTNAAPSLISHVDAEQRYVFVNDAFTRWFGVPRESILGRTVRDFVGESAWVGIGPKVARAYAGEKVEFEAQVPYQYGGTRWIHSSITPRLDASGRVAGVVTLINDVTEQKRVEEALREQAALLELAHDAIMVLDAQSKITFWNNGAQETYGWSREEALGQVAHELLKTRFPRPVAQLEAEVAERGQWDGELTHWRKDGREIVVASRWAVQRDQHGKQTGVLEINRDITERKRVEQDLLKKNERLQFLSEAAERLLSARAPEATVRELFDTLASQIELDVYFNYLVDDSGTAMRLDSYVGVSEEAAQSIQRLEIGQAFCGTIARATEVKDVQHCGDLKTGLIRGLGIQSYVCFPLLSADQLLGTLSFGSRRRREFSPEEVELLRTVSCYVAVAQEQACRRRNLEKTVQEQTAELRESEQRFRTMADCAPVLMWVCGTDKKCVFVNRGWLEFTGRSIEQELGHGWADVVHPDDMQRCLKTYFDFFDARQPFEMEYRARRHDGEYRFVLDRGVPRWAINGDFLGYVGVVMDLTDRKTAEEARQKLIHVSRLAVVGELTTMIAHELNQPLTAMRLNLDVVKTLLESAPMNEVHDVLADIRADNVRAAEAIRRIRALVSKHEMEMRIVDINAIVLEAANLAKADVVGRRGVQFHVECHAPCATVRGDSVHLQQVVLNLIVNGLDALKSVAQADRHLYVSTSAGVDGYVEVKVKDTGQGIEPENLSRVFESFFTTKPDGMGMGLSLARSIVQLHSGRLWAENNRDGKGSTFCVILPIAVTEPAPPVASESWDNARSEINPKAG